VGSEVRIRQRKLKDLMKEHCRFGDEGRVDVDLLIDPDEAWSVVRRHILSMMGEKTATERWVPHFMGASGFYGVSRIEVGTIDPEILWAWTPRSLA
jgi:hypothetical protein